MLISDGKTPEEKTQQILAIAPILPGQQTLMPPTPQVSISQGKHSPSNLDTQQVPGGDLIDFGDEVLTPKTATTTHAPSSENAASLAELQSPIVRRDTGDSVDEFVDAEP